MGKKKGITIGKTRSALYGAGRVLGDVNAVTRGTLGQRLVSRVIGGLFSRVIGSIVRGFFGRR